ATQSTHGRKIHGPRSPRTAPAAGDFSTQRTQTARQLCWPQSGQGLKKEKRQLQDLNRVGLVLTLFFVPARFRRKADAQPAEILLRDPAEEDYGPISAS